MKKVMVFGVFDGVHEGHRALFKQAREHGDHLIIAVAMDSVVETLKGLRPAKNAADRIVLLQSEALVDEAVPGDDRLGDYGVIKKHRPDVIALGYDQVVLEYDLIANRSMFDWDPQIILMKPYEPETYHNSLLRSDQ